MTQQERLIGDVAVELLLLRLEVDTFSGALGRRCRRRFVVER